MFDIALLVICLNIKCEYCPSAVVCPLNASRPIVFFQMEALCCFKHFPDSPHTSSISAMCLLFKASIFRINFTKRATVHHFANYTTFATQHLFRKFGLHIYFTWAYP